MESDGIEPQALAICYEQVYEVYVIVVLLHCAAEIYSCLLSVYSWIHCLMKIDRLTLGYQAGMFV